VVTLVALFLGKIVKIKKGLGDKVSIGRDVTAMETSTPAISAIEKRSSIQDPESKLRAENDLLRERIADLENQLRARSTYS
jgi:prefoldin subunit 5